jgi:hypothetical protein
LAINEETFVNYDDISGGTIVENYKQLILIHLHRRMFIMGIAEVFVLAFITLLGFLAYNNSRKVSREIKKMSPTK